MRGGYGRPFFIRKPTASAVTVATGANSCAVVAAFEGKRILATVPYPACS